MSSARTASNTTAATQFLQVKDHSYAYRRFGNGSGVPLLCLQHFTGTLDNWDPAVTNPLACGREVILFDNAGVGRSTGEVSQTIAGMAGHAMVFLDALGLQTCDVIGYSLGVPPHQNVLWEGWTADQQESATCPAGETDRGTVGAKVIQHSLLQRLPFEAAVPTQDKRSVFVRNVQRHIENGSWMHLDIAAEDPGMMRELAGSAFGQAQSGCMCNASEISLDEAIERRLHQPRVPPKQQRNRRNDRAHPRCT
jgi:hypothetical protein